jgi:ABC-type lipopolysaccharide export system ATPase subunit
MQDYSLAGERGFERLVAFFPAFARYYHTPVAMLSGGERRILEIYVVLSTAGLFCLLDEPFSQISPVNVATLKTLIAEEKPSKGILISDHRYEDVYEISDNLYIIAGGTTYSVSSPDDLRRYGYTKL